MMVQHLSDAIYILTLKYPDINTFPFAGAFSGFTKVVTRILGLSIDSLESVISNAVTTPFFPGHYTESRVFICINCLWPLLPVEWLALAILTLQLKCLPSLCIYRLVSWFIDLCITLQKKQKMQFEFDLWYLTSDNIKLFFFTISCYFTLQLKCLPNLYIIKVGQFVHRSLYHLTKTQKMQFEFDLWYLTSDSYK